MTVQGSKNAVLPILGVDHSDRRKDDTAKLPGYFGCGLHVPHFAENRRNSDKNRSRDLRGRFRCAAKQASGRGSGSDAFLHRADGRAFGRLGQASFCDPGGCVIGDRPIDLHLKAFARFGCQIRREDDNFLTVFAKRLNGVQIRFPFSSVGATQNAIFMRGLCKGRNSADRLCKGTGGRFAVPLFKRCRGKDRRSRKQNDSN